MNMKCELVGQRARQAVNLTNEKSKNVRHILESIFYPVQKGRLNHGLCTIKLVLTLSNDIDKFSLRQSVSNLVRSAGEREKG